MNTQSNAPSESFGSNVAAPQISSSVHPMYWCIRRELWESRSVYLAPLAAAAVALFGFMISMTHFSARMREILSLDPMRQQHALTQPYEIATALVMGAAFIVSIFYSLDALYSERRDRSILFWKSLPVSDLTTVLSKASIPLLILPLLAFTIVIVTIAIMLLMNAAALVGSNFGFAELWSRLGLFQSGVGLLYHLVTVHILWYAPLYAWLLFISAWARRAPFLWAFLPPLVLAAFEKITFHTSYVAHLLQSRVAGGSEASMGGNNFAANPHMPLTPGTFLGEPGLWIGLLVAAALIAAAVRMRRYRGPV
jgi:ABC-2 type transport system permease protein